MSTADINDFLQRKGSVEIIVEIGSGSSTFQNIKKSVLVSSSTISNRLKDGVEIELFDVTHRPTEYGTQKRYELTPIGNRVFEWIQEIDMDSAVRELQRVQRKRDSKLDRLLDFVRRDMSLHDTENIWGDFPSDDGVENSFEEPIDEIEPEQLEEKRKKKTEREAGK
jgi:hypothetical protein